MSKKTMTLVGLAVAAYFLFFRKPAMAAPAPSAAPPPPTDGTGLPSWVNPIAAATAEMVKLASGTASESKAIEGMAPATLTGHVASLGGYGDLGGSFYGTH